MRNLLAAAAILMAASPAISASAGAPAQGAPIAAYAGGMHGKPAGGADSLAKILELTPDQEKQLTAAQDENRKAMMPLQQERMKIIEELSKLTEVPGTSEADLKAKLDALKANRKAIVAQQEKYTDKMNEILNVRQQAKVAVLMESHAMGRGPMGGPAGGQMGGPGFKHPNVPGGPGTLPPAKTEAPGK